MKIIGFLLMGLLSSVLWAQETSSLSQGISTAVYQDALEYQRHIQTLERKLQEYKLKLELARTLKDSLATGLVDFEGNLNPEQPAIPKLDLSLGEAEPVKAAIPAASPPPPVAEVSSPPSPKVSLPILVAIQGKKAIFSTLSGVTIEGKVGSRLPGDYMIKEIRLTEVVMESDGTQFVAKLNWQARKPTKTTEPRGSMAQRIL